jgi:hypothetical protein
MAGCEPQLLEPLPKRLVMRTARLATLGLVVIGTIVAFAWSVATADDTGKGKVTPPTTSDPANPQNPPLPNRKQLMADKLNYAQQILNGLAMNDREKIQTSAEKLVAISKVAEWLNADKTEEYEFQMKLFRRAAKTIGEKAKEKNIDGVMLAYTEMTITCLKCHQHERDFR